MAETHVVAEQADSPTSLLRVRSEKRGDAVVVRVVGELDLASAPVLDDLLVEAEIGGVAPLVLDLTGVTFMASAGLALLMKHDERCRAAVTVMDTLAGALDEK